MLGWLMACDPPEQSAGQISEAIGASRASLTSNLLTGMGFLTWRTRPGERTVYYRMAVDAWGVVVRRQIASITSFLDITRDGLGLVGPDDDRAARVRQAHATCEWMAKVFHNAPLLPPGQLRRCGDGLTRQAIVVGGGIAGLAAALALQRIGWQATVPARSNWRTALRMPSAVNSPPPNLTLSGVLRDGGDFRVCAYSAVRRRLQQ
ncbi:GbsR/MarR family transcriptional regulator [Nonomuraea sp. NPDC049400]|uniref:GbsR/MarR family transcriptional regulator n=1 Tax=Nonomuraea sp. NPDC049400 TaxID=3364352 RepID=UPI0037B1B1C6